MTDQEVLRRTREAVQDAMSPLFGPNGIVAGHFVVFVSLEAGLMPVMFGIGISEDTMAGTLLPAALILTQHAAEGYPEIEMKPLPVKN